LALCRNFNALPVAGGILDQPKWFIEMSKVYLNAEREGAKKAQKGKDRQSRINRAKQAKK